LPFCPTKKLQLVCPGENDSQTDKELKNNENLRLGMLVSIGG
jgi:hypothetical protein